MGEEIRRRKSSRNGVHYADAVVWEPVYRTHLTFMTLSISATFLNPPTLPPRWSPPSIAVAAAAAAARVAAAFAADDDDDRALGVESRLVGPPARDGPDARFHERVGGCVASLRSLATHLAEARRRARACARRGSSRARENAVSGAPRRGVAWCREKFPSVGAAKRDRENRYSRRDARALCTRAAARLRPRAIRERCRGSSARTAATR